MRQNNETTHRLESKQPFLLHEEKVRIYSSAINYYNFSCLR